MLLEKHKWRGLVILQLCLLLSDGVFASSDGIDSDLVTGMLSGVGAVEYDDSDTGGTTCTSGGSFQMFGIGTSSSSGNSLSASDSPDVSALESYSSGNLSSSEASELEDSQTNYCSLVDDSVSSADCFDVGLASGMNTFLDASSLDSPGISVDNVGITLTESGSIAYCTLSSDNSGADPGSCVCICGAQGYTLSVNSDENSAGYGEVELLACNASSSCSETFDSESYSCSVEDTIDSGGNGSADSIAMSASAAPYTGDDLTYSQSDLLAPPATDLSMYYLGFIFGQVLDILPSATGQSLLGVMFNVFSLGILIITGWMVAYSVIASVFKNASDVQEQGSTSVFWGPLRAGVGVILLLPLFSGYSMIQGFVMWAVVQGIGVADAIWAEAVNYIDAQGGGVYQAAVPNDYSYLKMLLGGTGAVTDASGMSTGGKVNSNQMLASSLCLQTLAKQAAVTSALPETSESYTASCQTYLQKDTCEKREIIDAYVGQSNLSVENDQNLTAEDAGTDSDGVQSWTITIVTPRTTDVDPDTYHLRTGEACGLTDDAGGTDSNVICYGSSDDVAMCGRFKWSALTSGIGGYSASEVNQRIQDANIQMAQAMDALAQTVYPAAYDVVSEDSGSDQVSLLSAFTTGCASGSSSNCTAASLWLSVISSYYTTIKPFLVDTGTQGADWIESAKSLGWLVAGMHYWDLIGTDGLSATDLTLLPPDTYLPEVETNRSALLDSSATSVLDSSVATTYTIALGAISAYANAVVDLINTEISAGLLSLATVTDSDNYGSNVASDTIPTTEDITATSSDALLASMDLLLRNALVLGVHNDYTSTDFPTTASMVTADVGLVQNNLRAFFASLIGAMFGIEAVDASYSGNDMYDDNNVNADGNAWASGGNSWSDVNIGSRCYGLAEPDGDCEEIKIDTSWSCYNAALAEDTNGKTCILEGQGMIGSMVASMNGSHYDPILNLTNMGNIMLKTAIGFWQQTSAGVYSVSKDLSIGYAEWMGGLGAASATGAAIAGYYAEKADPGGTSMGLNILEGTIQFIGNIFSQMTQYYYAQDLMYLTILLPFSTAFVSVFFALGGILAYYVPLVPFTIFIFSALGWFIATIEAIIAMPLVALGITHPQGHDFLGRIEQAVILLLGVFIQPAVIIVGFIAAIMVSYVSITLFNYGYIIMMATYFGSFLLDQDVSTIGQIITMLSLMIVYCYMVMDLVTQSFSMTYQVPERIVRWIGGIPSQSTTSQAMGEMRGAAGSTSRLGDAAGGVASRGRLAGDISGSVQAVQGAASAGFSGVGGALGDEKQNVNANTSGTKKARAALGFLGAIAGGG